MTRIDEPTSAFRTVAALCRPVIRHAFRLRAIGSEHLPRGGFVLCANHLSALDAWALSQPLYPRQPCYMAKAELFRAPLRPLLSSIGLFPVQRGRCCSAAIAAAIAHARAGRVVVVFPEGTRRKKARDAQTSPRPGAAYIALEAGVPLVPAAVAGTQRLLDAPWRVAFGQRIELADLKELPAREAAREATRRLWQRIESLQEQIR